MHDAGEIHDAEQDEHQADGKFHRESDARRNYPAEQNDRAAYGENRQCVAHAPESADHRGVLDAAMPRDNGGHGDDVIRIRGMPHAKEKSQRDYRK